MAKKAKKAKKTKKKATKKQLANLAKGRAVLKAKHYGVTHEFPRAYVHLGHSPLRGTCKHCDKPHSTSQHNAHAVYGEGKRIDKVVPAYALTHKISSHPLKGVLTSHHKIGK